MWKTRGLGLWQEFAATIPRRKVSSWPHRNPNCFRNLINEPNGLFCGATTSHREHHGPPVWSRATVRLRFSDASGAGRVGRGRRADVLGRATAEDVASGRGFDSQIADRREVVKMLSMEDLYENVVMPSRESTVLHGGNVDVDMERGTYNKMQNGGNVLRFQSGGAQRNPLAGAEYRRRRSISGLGKFGGNGPHRQGSLREFTHHAASETYLITRLAITLLKLLGFGFRWIGKFIRLGLYAVFLMPGFIQESAGGKKYMYPESAEDVALSVNEALQVGYFYYFDQRIHRSIEYGDQPRNRFDLYLPPESDKPKPVVIFITGGAWVIGYKAWGSLLAQQLVERDIIVACIDYRNFPQGCISDMVSDVSTGIGYVYQNVESFGGDPNMVYLAGQSAGAHLAACSLLIQAEKEVNEDPAKLVWRSSQIKAYLAISGGYNLIKLVEYFHTRGLYKSIMLRVMEGEKSLPIYSPEYIVKTPTFKKAVPLLPPITLFHGTGDYSIPHEASETFAAALQSVGARVETIFYPDKTHTDLFLQDPMRGGKDELLADILAVVHANDEEARAEDLKNTYSRRRLVPEFLLQLARRVSPF